MSPSCRRGEVTAVAVLEYGVERRVARGLGVEVAADGRQLGDEIVPVIAFSAVLPNSASKYAGSSSNIFLALSGAASEKVHEHGSRAVYMLKANLCSRSRSLAKRWLLHVLRVLRPTGAQRRAE